jgi:hypothetical protein
MKMLGERRPTALEIFLPPPLPPPPPPRANIGSWGVEQLGRWVFLLSLFLLILLVLLRDQHHEGSLDINLEC